MAANTNSLSLTRASSQYATAANETPFRLQSFIAISAWIKLNSTGIKQMIFSKSDGSGADYAWEFYVDTDNKLRFLTCTNNPTTLIVTANTALSASTWYHVMAIYTQSTHTVDFYVNNVSDGSPTGASSAQRVSGVPAVLGSSAPTVGNYFDGLIDEVVIASSAFTTNQRAQLFQGYDVSNIGLSGVVAYWKLNNDYTDASGNSQTLTATNSPTFSATVPFANYAGLTGGYRSLLGIGS